MFKGDVVQYIRKEVGVRPFLLASSVGLGAATLILLWSGSRLSQPTYSLVMTTVF